ncbi:MAG TPA: adenosylcobinamide-phosphate synthase CbiB [Xanthobacteraceae bacterium]|nr:adenosylcobinamide-phosphate synthase CbiB [Xanthobacteraceae bacterium]
MSLAIALFAMLIELCFGYPDWLYRAIGHPVVWIGKLITTLERYLNREQAPVRRYLGGIVAILVLLAIVGAIAVTLQRELLRLPYGAVLVAILAATFLAQRSLYRHVADVALSLERHGLEAARTAVARIVGRDTATLDESGVARAAIESLAENFSDGIVAPVLWTAVGGLPGVAVYKAINTADSMIGHRTARFAAFGWAAARLDDVINLPASRLSALLLVIATTMRSDTSTAAAWNAVWRDASKHRSPNAGYPEAAVAGALGLALAGPRTYNGIPVNDATMGDGRPNADAADIRRALALYWCADALLIVILIALFPLIVRS